MPARCACEGVGLRAAIRADADRYLYEVERDGRAGWFAVARVAVLSSGLWATIAYRLAHFAVTRVRPAPLAAFASMVCLLLHRAVQLVTTIDIDHRAHVGPGLMIPHTGYVVIGPGRIGRCCTICQGVTLGMALTDGGTASAETAPTVDDRVWIGPGAVLAGPVTVGPDALVGANSVLQRDVPPRGVVLGSPARLVSRAGSFGQVTYRGMDDDQERLDARQDVVITLPSDTRSSGASS